MERQMKKTGVEWIARIPSNWSVDRLKGLFTFGKGLPITKDDLAEAGIPVISYGQIHAKETNGVGIQLHLIRYVSPEYIGRNPSSLVSKGDHIFADTSEDLEGCGNSVYIDEEMELFAGYHTIILQSRKHEDNKYLAYLFRTDAWRSQIRSKVSGVKLYSISRKILADTTIIMPPADERDRIVTYLDQQCALIDTCLGQIRASIGEYKKLKQAVITQAVTKGIRDERPMKSSGIEWAPEIPCNWAIIPSKFMFRNSDERKQDGDVMLTSSQKYGIISQNEYMERENSKIVLANRGLDDWKHVEPYDFIISLRSFQGGLEMSETTGCITWHYIVLKPCREIYSNYYKWLFKSEAYIKALQRTCNYIRDGQDLRYSNFVQVPLVVPELGEQEEIAKYLDKKCAEIDTLIAKKAALLENLEAYKKSVIYEYVTGKKVVPNSESAVIAVDPILLKALLYAKTHELLGKNCRGRIQIQKMLYLIESMNDLKIGSQYVRQKFGPLDVDLDKIESFMEQKRWLKTIQGSPTSYKKMDHYKEYRTEFSKYLAPYEAEIKRIIHFFENMNTSQAERFATLMAVWNDFILDGNANPSDEELIHEVITNWHPHKANYKYTTWQDTVNKMRANGIIPHGYGTHTILHQDNFLS